MGAVCCRTPEARGGSGAGAYGVRSSASASGRRKAHRLALAQKRKRKKTARGEFAALAAGALESARADAQAKFKKELRAARETVRPSSRAAQNLRGYVTAGRPPAIDIVLGTMRDHHERNRALYIANAHLLVRRAGSASMQSIRDPDAAQGLLRRDEARQLLRKFLLMQKLDPPIGRMWDQFEECYGAVDSPEEYSYHVLSECASDMRRAAWRDLTLLVDEMAEEYQDMAEQVFARVPPQNPSAPPEAQHVAVEAFVDAYIEGSPQLEVRTSLRLSVTAARSDAAPALRRQPTAARTASFRPHAERAGDGLPRTDADAVAGGSSSADIAPGGSDGRGAERELPTM